MVRNKEALAILTEPTQSAFAQMEITEGMYKSIANSIRASKKGNYVFHYNHDALIILANHLEYVNNIADCACALENMMITANEFAKLQYTLYTAKNVTVIFFKELQHKVFLQFCFYGVFSQRQKCRADMLRMG